MWCGVVVGLAIGWGVLFGWLAARNHANYGTWAYDLAIYDQAFWAIAHGETFLSIRGLPVWGHHLNVVGVAFAPAYWLGAGATFLVVVQALTLGAAAIPLWLIARLRLGNAVAGAAVAGAYLLYTPVQFLAWRDFHPEALVVTPMLCAWYCALTARWRWFAVAIVVAVATREDAALAVTVLGAVMWWWGRRDGSSPGHVLPDGGRSARRRGCVDAAAAWRRAGLWTFAGGVAYYLLATQVVLPLVNDGNGAFYLSYFYGDWGGSLPRILGNVVVHPDWLWRDATAPDRLRFYRDLLAPVGFLPLLSPTTLAIAGPQLFGSVISSQPYPRSVMYQYTAVMIAPLMIATVEGARRLMGWVGGTPRTEVRATSAEPSGSPETSGRRASAMPNEPSESAEPSEPAEPPDRDVPSMLLESSMSSSGPRSPVDVASTEPPGRSRRVRLAWLVPAGLLVAALATNVAWSLSPIGAHFEAAWGRDNPRRAQLDAAVAAIPADAATSSTYNLTPHLAQRRWAFDWPNPWVPLYYGNAAPFDADCAALVDATTVDYLVLDRQLLSDESRLLVAAMVGPGGDFEIVSDDADVLVARRVASGPGGIPLPGNCSTGFAPVLAAYEATAPNR